MISNLWIEELPCTRHMGLGGGEASSRGGTQGKERPAPEAELPHPPATAWEFVCLSFLSGEQEREAREASPSSELCQGCNVRTETQDTWVLRCC